MMTKATHEENSVGAIEGRSVLVDTSLLIEQLKREKHARPVREALAKFAFQGSSSYSNLEIKRAWFKRLAYIFDVCRKPGVESIADVVDWINNKLTYMQVQRRMLQACLSQLAQFLDLDRGGMTERARLRRLGAHCKNAILSATQTIIQTSPEAFDGTQCVRARELPEEQRDGSVDVTIRRCSPEHIQCRVHLFFQEHRSLFDAIANYVEATDNVSEELQTMREHIAIAGRDPVHLCNDRHCCKLADGIIAIDGHEMDEFAANNDREWMPLASIFGKPLNNPVRNTRVEP